MANLIEDKNQIFTPEDYKLKWLPAIYKFPICPKCKQQVRDHWEYDPTDPRPWADPYWAGHFCEHCQTLYLSDEEVEWKTEKEYHPYSVYLQGEMSNEELDWFYENNIMDIRNYKKED